MFQKIRKQNEGFTIIEVLIVLAIAGLILLIVFIAVPALQRNSRNTQRRNDIASMLGIVSEYSNNNNGQVPTNGNSGLFGKNAFVGGGVGTQQAQVALSYYDSGAGMSLTWNNAVTTNTTTLDTVVLRSGAICSGTTGNATTTGASGRSIVALFTLEGGAKQCQAS